jgi:hypothetical protein
MRYGVSVELGRMLVKVKVKHGVFCVWRVAMCDCSNVSVVTACRVVSADVNVRCDNELRSCYQDSASYFR